MDEEQRRLQEAAELAAATGISMTPFGEMGGNLMECYEEMRRAGFDPQQSLWLTGCAMTGHVGLPPLGK